MDTSKSQNKSIIAIIVVVLLVVAAGIVVAVSNNQDTTTTTSKDDTAQTETAQTTGDGDANAAASTGDYKDGTYSATGSYRTPGGQESIDVEVTLAGGVISDASVTQNATGGEAEEYQDKFTAAYKSEVVGKKIDEVSLSRIAGSSLTPLGFNTALDTIKSEAQV